MAHRLVNTALLLTGLVAALTFPGCASDDPAAPTQRVTLNGRTFELELALDDESRYRGLSGREHIPEDGGMLFVFPYAREVHFVMRDCPNPIDVVFLGPNGRVVSMHAMRPEPGVPESQLTRYASRWPVQFAIELRGGTLAELALEPGQRVDLPMEELKRRAR